MKEKTIKQKLTKKGIKSVQLIELTPEREKMHGELMMKGERTGSISMREIEEFAALPGWDHVMKFKI